MPVDRRPNDQSVHHVHTHTCPECKRSYSCNCVKQYDDPAVICKDCEAGVDVGQSRSNS